MMRPPKLWTPGRAYPVKEKHAGYAQEFGTMHACQDKKRPSTC